ncbi:general stress protein [Lysobacter helvus]|uniref:General stress protein n=2 Tax=Lysobacteraceae TaxID=32033 RepID=A0ABN6FVN1_9GAMM|nr:MULTISPECIES: pyridoxamine 5'-phosphate oxidase family protein [Lysobacter]BCT93753.1 general stress protein [Lysobacter caseinilyticus]BCT96909.1 general stress protein [Lysobacter helvus]
MHHEHDPSELAAKFWKALKSDRTLMLGLDGVEDGHSRPMTAQIEGDAGGPIWFFTGKPNAVADHLEGNGSRKNGRAIAAFTSKGHDLFASVQGTLTIDNDRAVIDRLWNPFIAAWFEGKDDPKLVLLRFDPDHAEIWLNESNLLAGVKMLLGIDPKVDYKDNSAEVDLRNQRVQ